MAEDAGVAALSDFYGRFGSVSLTLLGLWLAVVGIRYDALVAHRQRWRKAGAVALIFGLPGVMSLLSLIDVDDASLWRVSFVLGGVLGAVGVLAAMADDSSVSGQALLTQIGLAISGVLYVAIVVVALLSESLQDSSLELTPLQLEAILFSTMMTIGLTIAWLTLFGRDPQPR